jgi:hypothetical protein
MTAQSWIRSLFARRVTRLIRKRAHCASPTLQALEDRLLPSFTVTNLLDDGSVGSLRWAVGQANSTNETINFDPTVFKTPQTITLTGSQLELANTTGTETIQGPTVGVTINGGMLSRVLQIDSQVTGSISGVTISQGNVTSFSFASGGGLLNYGTTTLTNCTISGSIAHTTSSGYFDYGFGGGISNQGTLSLTNCTVIGNSASSYNAYGGGISNQGTLSLTNCTVSGNVARTNGYGFGEGGGISSHGTLSLTNCTVSENYLSANYAYGAGISNHGSLSLTSCTVSGNLGTNRGTDNRGGGIFNADTATLINCTISGNSDLIGGGLAFGSDRFLTATTTLTNCTISSNYGEGLFNEGTTTLTNCTISGNNGGGLYSRNGFSTTTLNNTLVAGNSSFSSYDPDIEGACTSTSGFNLIGNGTGLTGISNGVNGNQIGTAANPINPLLATLGNYGGPTQTQAHLPGSPALDAGSNALAVDSNGNPLTTDQRGLPRIVNGTVDIGAFESSGFSIRDAGGNFQGGQVGQAFTIPLTVQVNSKHNEPVAGGVVTFTAPATGASALLTPTQATISSAGLASTLASANTSAGGYIVTASVNPHSTPVNFYLSNLPGPATQFQILATQAAKVNTPFPFVVLARDVYGNRAAGYTGTVAFSSSDPLAVLPDPYTFLGSDQGAHVFTATLNTAGSQTLTATDTSNSSITGLAVIGVHSGLAPASAFVSVSAAGVEAGLGYDDLLQQTLDPAGLYVGGR